MGSSKKTMLPKAKKLKKSASKFSMHRKRCIAFVIVFLLSGLFNIDVLNQDGNISYAMSNPPTVSALSGVLVEMTSGRILYSKASDQRLPMASTTKIITAITAIESEGFDGNKQVEISEKAAMTEGSSMYLKKGEKLTLTDLLYGLMLSSGNDAAVAIAEEIGENEEDFIAMMNNTAKKVGAENTNVTNPNGLPDDNHYSTAEDMAKITAYALKNPVFKEIVTTKMIDVKSIDSGDNTVKSLKNHNKLLWMYDGCIGVKTGYTQAAGRCLVSAAEKNGMTLIGVTLNAADDWNDHINMLNFGFDNFTMKKIVDKDINICDVEVMGSGGVKAAIRPADDIFYPLNNTEETENPSTEINIYPEICSPVKKGDQVGTMKISVPQGIDKAETFDLSAELVSANDIDNENDNPEVFLSKLKRIILMWVSVFNLS